jgi:hypothetical protein
LSSCGSTGTFTYTYGGGWGGNGWWGGSTKTWPTGTVTVTGCPWDGGWGGFWGPADGSNGNGNGNNNGGNTPWNSKGPGWTYATRTQLITATSTDNNGNRFTTTRVATIGEARSGSTTSFTTLPANFQSPNAAAPTADMLGVQVMGAALGAVVAVAGMM